MLALPDAAELLEQSVLLIGQCSNAVTYERRRNVLSSISSGTSHISTMLIDNKDILKKNEDEMIFDK